LPQCRGAFVLVGGSGSGAHSGSVWLVLFWATLFLGSAVVSATPKEGDWYTRCSTIFAWILHFARSPLMKM